MLKQGLNVENVSFKLPKRSSPLLKQGEVE